MGCVAENPLVQAGVSLTQLQLSEGYMFSLSCVERHQQASCLFSIPALKMLSGGRDLDKTYTCALEMFFPSVDHSGTELTGLN